MYTIYNIRAKKEVIYNKKHLHSNSVFSSIVNNHMVRPMT